MNAKSGDAPPSSTMAEDSNGSKARPGFLRSMMHTLGLDHLKRPRSPSGATQPSDGLSALTLAGSDEGGASTDNLEGQIIKGFDQFVETLNGRVHPMTGVGDAEFEAFFHAATMQILKTVVSYQSIAEEPLLVAVIARRVTEALWNQLSFNRAASPQLTTPTGAPVRVMHDLTLMRQFINEKFDSIVQSVHRQKEYRLILAMIHFARKLLDRPNYLATTFGHFSSLGRRDANEDYHVALPYFGDLFDKTVGKNSSFYAIYDGHGGSACANFISIHLHVQIARHPLFETDMPKALQESFMDTQGLWIDAVDRYGFPATTGSTAVIALFQESLLHVAYAGDSSAIIFLKNGTWCDFVIPHKSAYDYERARIEMLGGFIHNERVNGHLAVTRSFGDLEYGCVNPFPDIVEYHMNGSEQFLVLVCDGLTDVFDPGMVLDIVSKQRSKNATPEQISRELSVQAVQAGSADNVSVVYIPLDLAETAAAPIALEVAASTAADTAVGEEPSVAPELTPVPTTEQPQTAPPLMLTPLDLQASVIKVGETTPILSPVSDVTTIVPAHEQSPPSAENPTIESTVVASESATPVRSRKPRTAVRQRPISTNSTAADIRALEALTQQFSLLHEPIASQAPMEPAAQDESLKLRDTLRQSIEIYGALKTSNRIASSTPELNQQKYRAGESVGDQK